MGEIESKKEHIVREFAVEVGDNLNERLESELNSAHDAGWVVYQALISDPVFHVAYENEVIRVKLLARRKKERIYMGEEET